MRTNFLWSTRSFFVQQVYFTKSCRKIWWRVNQPFILFIHHIWDTQYFEALLVQDKLDSFNIQDDRSTRFLCTTNYRIDYIIKRFHGENSIMSELLSQKNLLLCSIQGNNAVLAKTLKNKSKINYTASRFSLLISAKFAVRAVAFLSEH